MNGLTTIYLKDFKQFEINSYFIVRTILYGASIISKENKLISVRMICTYVFVLSYNSHSKSLSPNRDAYV